MHRMSAMARVLSVLLGLVLSTAAPRPAFAGPASLPGEEAKEAKELNAQAQQMFADGRYAEAARTYARILEVLDENKINREERDNTLLIAIEVYRQAFLQGRDSSDQNKTREAASYLCDADELYAKYLGAYRDEYGSAADPSKAARESRDALTALIAEVEGELGSPPCGPAVAPDPDPVPEPVSDFDAMLGTGKDPPRGPSGMGLIIGGAVTLAAGLGATSMIIIGATSDPRNDGLIVAGSVTSGVLVAGGAVMLGIGIRRRMRYLAFSPTMNRGYVGLSLQGRF